MKKVHTAIPIDVHTKDTSTYLFASSSLCSEKLFPKKRGIPLGIPMAAIVANIVERDTTADDIPTTSAETILEIITQNI